MSDLNTLNRKIDSIAKSIEGLKEEYINEAEAAKWLGIEKKSLQNQVCNKTIPASCYVVVGKRRMYSKLKTIKHFQCSST